ncbi:hypothetical protein CTR2_R32490 [Comamonas thiooxydans]|uniref:ApeA N-terminal domain 1-containing protein n=1 Tax=Comamonas thiooxydans TaxID=363952 RepID=UPI000A2D6F33|nr:HEPN domain-containing protein [Comamonas thiooxydans]BDR09911.1 hypothetical protein CTR2_R32490 [Comamonas thiooxydans]
MRNHENYNGIFHLSDNQFTGVFNNAGADSILKIFGKSFWNLPETEYLDIHGMLDDGTKASLIDCVLHAQRRHRFDSNSQFETQFFPNYIVVGEEFISSGEPVIKAVSYHFDNVHSLLIGSKTFRSLSPDADEVRRILELDHRQLEDIAEENGWPKTPFEPQIGKHPQLLYFSGLWEIIACQSTTGKISLTNRTSQNSGSPSGIGIRNEVTANIEFPEPQTIKSVLHALRTLHSFFELSLGHSQRYRWIELELQRSTESEQKLPPRARLYWTLGNERVSGDSTVSRNSILLGPERTPDEFAKVLTGWMNSAESLGDPRERFSTAFFGSYSIDRIVGSANMFDLLPESHVPKTKQVDSSLSEALVKCREIFKDLPDSFAKQSVLSVLGRIGKASLRDKINYRADKILEVAGERFPELYLPCNQAVLCRNHYVHGSKSTFDYQENFTEFAFLVDTLEFIFAVSDLIDLGWDFRGWIGRFRPTTHPFSAYIANYSHNIIRLRNLVKK